MPELASNILPLQIMEEAVARGYVGMKSGRGLLEWSAARSAAVLQRRKQELLRRRHRETVQDESLFVS
jgi:3-hydroxyacyl-CoA dehydrogenase